MSKGKEIGLLYGFYSALGSVWHLKHNKGFGRDMMGTWAVGMMMKKPDIIL